MTETPDQLRRRADRIESRTCTGLTASWCPIHGDCTCPNRSEAMDSTNCPLHGYASSHAAGSWPVRGCPPRGIGQR